MPKLVELIFGPGSTRQAEKLGFLSRALPCNDLSTSFLRGGIHSTHEHLSFNKFSTIDVFHAVFRPASLIA